LYHSYHFHVAHNYRYYSNRNGGDAMCFGTVKMAIKVEKSTMTATLELEPNTVVATSSTTTVSTPTTDSESKLTKTQKKAIKKAKKKALEDLEKRRLINEAYKQERHCRSLVPLNTTAPEMKPVITFDDGMKPVFNVGDYVRVERDFSPGKRQQQGYGFVTEVFGVGAATLVNVQMCQVSGDGGSHKKIGIDMLTPSVFGAELHRKVLKRKRETPAELDFMTPPSKKQSTTKNLSPIEKLIKRLQAGASSSKKKGWYLREIRRESLKEKNVECPRLSREEKLKLWNEIGLLDSYRAMCGPAKQEQNKRNGRMKATSAASKALSLCYLVDIAYGRGKMFLSRLRKEAHEGELPPPSTKTVEEPKSVL
jgi:hypothetical protein